MPAAAASIEPLTIGVLALQGDFEAHGAMLTSLGVTVRQVRQPNQLDGCDGLVIPGGESTTMTLGVEREALSKPLRAFQASGHPVFGTCAGLIMLDRDHLRMMDIRAERNAFGRQVRSFEAPLDVGLPGGPIDAVFIRAPWIAEYGDAVEILAEVDGHPVAAREGNTLAVSFHPELGEDSRLHAMFVRTVSDARLAAA